MNPAHKNLILKALDADGINYKKVHLTLMGISRYSVTVNEKFYGIFDVEKNEFITREEC